MNPELLRATYLGATARFPPLPAIERPVLTELFGRITRRYPYQSFTFLLNGAKMAGAEEAECLILNDHVEVGEVIHTHFTITKEKISDIFGTVKEALKIPVFFALAVRLRALWPCDPGVTATDFLNSRLLKIEPDQFQYLRMPVAGVGLRFNCPRLPHEIYDFKIEPFFRDTTNLFIEMNAQFPEPLQTATATEERMQHVYDYVFGEIKSFICAF